MGSENPTGADNQQGSCPHPSWDVLATPQRLHAELLAIGAKGLEAYLQGAKEAPTVVEQDEDIVRAPWRHGGSREQGSRTGRCGWITSFLRSHCPAITAGNS